MKHKQTDVTFLAAPFGFGPLGKALAIAHEFERRGYTTKILGDISAQKIAQASGIYVESYEYRKPLDLSTLNTRLVLSCLDISTPIIKSGIPLILVDSLFWLRGRWEKLPSYSADVILAQRFFIKPHEKAKALVGDRLRMVDAILPAQPDTPLSIDSNLIVLYPGGMRSPYLDIQYQERYLLWAIDMVSEAIHSAHSKMSDLIIIAPPQLQTPAITDRITSLGSKIKFGVGDLGYFLRNSQCFITAPGIEATLESYASGKLPHYLPAFNGSHIPQLIAYRKEGIGRELCPSYANELRQIERTTDSLSTLSMAVEKSNIEKLTKLPYSREGIKNLVTALENAQEVQNRYPLGKDGAIQCVDIALSLL